MSNEKNGPTDMTVEDLAMLVLRLVHFLRKTGENNDLCDAAMAYIVAGGQRGDVMRGDGGGK